MNNAAMCLNIGIRRILILSVVAVVLLSMHKYSLRLVTDNFLTS